MVPAHFSLIPAPQVMEALPGRFDWHGESLRITHHPTARREARRLSDLLDKRSLPRPTLIEEADFPPFGLAVAALGIPAIPQPGLDSTHPEGYILRVTEESAAITGADPPGLFYGVQTLGQLILDKEPTPAVQIFDWPRLSIRGMHLDLKGCTPTFAHLCELVVTLARHKINSLLIEYEDKFPYERHPVLRSPEALTPDELRTFLDLCRDHHLQTIPLLQSLGHVEYILRHPEYALLREEGSAAQFCPQHPGSLALFQELLAEILVYHQDAAYIHIGADECRDLGKCSHCRAAMAAKGRTGLYLDHVNACLRHVQSLGKTPILWADMIRNACAPELMNRVQTGAVPCDWLYDVSEDEVPFVYWGGGERLTSRRWLEIDPVRAASRNGLFIEDLPADQLQVMRKYWDRGRFPLWNDSLPLVLLLTENRSPVLGCCATKGGTSSRRLFPEWGETFGNIVCWGRRAASAGLLGVFGTTWARWSSLMNPCEPLEYGWYTMLAAADYFWHPRPADRAEFDHRFVQEFLGLPDDTVPRAMRALENTGSAEAAIQLLTPIQGQGLRPTHLVFLLKAAEVAAYQAGARAFLDDLDVRAYQFDGTDVFTIPDAEREVLIRRVEAFLDKRREIAAGLETTLRSTMKPTDAREVVLSQLGGLERRLRDYLQLLRAGIDTATRRSAGSTTGRTL